MLKLVNNSCYFEIIILSLHESLNELNINNIIVDSYELDNKEDIYLICTTHENKDLPIRYISYNFEQLITDKQWNETFFKKLKKAEYILDYSLENIKYLKENHNINAHFLPLGFSNCMVYNTTFNTNKTIDIIFLGLINTNRYKKLENLITECNQNNKKIVISNNYWGQDLINLYYNTKIGINIHYYTGKTILEVHRIIPLIANKIWVVSEKSDDIWYDNNFKELIDFNKDYLTVLKNYNIEELNRRYNILITKYKYIDYIRNILPIFNNI